MSSLYEAKLFKNNKWKTMLPLTGFSLCKPNIYNGWRHTLSLWRIRYKLCRHLVCYHCLNNSGSLKLMWCSDHLKNILFSYWWQYMFSLQSPIRGIIGRGIFFKWLLHHISFNLLQRRGELVHSANIHIDVRNSLLLKKD